VVLQTSKVLWHPWAALWNGNLSLADEIIAPDYVAHFAPVRGSPDEVRGPEGLKGWIARATAPFADHHFTTVVGPLGDGDMVAGRWVFRATYLGGIPGASSEAIGRPVEYAGMDIFRVEAGQIAEYWLSADVLQLLQQLGVIPS
jgi:predicted ester cyclase